MKINTKENNNICFTIMLDSSIQCENKKYLFRYKNTTCKFISGAEKGMTDCINIHCKKQEIRDKYKEITELLSAIAFEGKVHFIAKYARYIDSTHDIKSCSTGAQEKRSLLVLYTVNTLIDLPFSKVNNFEQSTVLRLLRQATVSNNEYLRMLFYWHVLTFPNEKDEEAVSFINNNISLYKNIYRGEMDMIENNTPFIDKSLKQSHYRNGGQFDFGKYFKEGARHSIAHIKRSYKGNKDIDLDDLLQEEHLMHINTILWKLCMEKIRNKFKVKRCADQSIFCLI